MPNVHKKLQNYSLKQDDTLFVSRWNIIHSFSIKVLSSSDPLLRFVHVNRDMWENLGLNIKIKND